MNKYIESQTHFVKYTLYTDFIEHNTVVSRITIGFPIYQVFHVIYLTHCTPTFEN